MSLRTFFFGLSICVFALVANAACDGSSAADCGAATCGACQEGFVNVDRCEDGEWLCDCVPRGDAATSSSVDGGNDATSSSDAGDVLTCQQKLANPTASGTCPADEWDKPCEQGCLSCRCSGGTWEPCTTSASCFDGGGG